jgi:hypothetical protein
MTCKYFEGQTAGFDVFIAQKMAFGLYAEFGDRIRPIVNNCHHQCSNDKICQSLILRQKLHEVGVDAA